ncbi:MAG: O-antigen ligase family protein [Pyrinomonadaceae bacterium]
MQRILELVDDVGAIDTSGLALVLERASFIFLALMVAAAPHSIAATQTAWLIGMAAWVARQFVARGSYRRDQPNSRARQFLNYALWALLIWSAISSLMSYEPAISLDRLRGVSVLLIFFFVVGCVRTRRAAIFLGLLLIYSCMVNVVWTPIERVLGRGVEIHGVSPDGPLGKALLYSGDTLLEVNRQKVSSPEEVVAALELSDVSEVKFYRPDFDAVVKVKKGDVLAGDSATAQLGIDGWSKSHNWRSKGFYGHYTTYAEVLQLIASLLFGLVIASISKRRGGEEQRSEGAGSTETAARARSLSSTPPLLPSSIPRLLTSSTLLIISLAAMCFALLLTVTRASQLAFMISAFVIVILGASRKMAMAAVLLALPIAFGGLLFLQQSRNTGFFDSRDESTRYRFVMWRDGVRIWSESPRNIVFGVGMDSIQKRWQEWGMYEGGSLPMGHFHSTLVQLLVERGLPALLIWLIALAAYIWILLVAIRRMRSNAPPDRDARLTFGMLLGCLGGAIGFFASGIVHYNLGDQEVAMVFYLLMGLGVRLACETVRRPNTVEKRVEYRLAA